MLAIVIPYYKINFFEKTLLSVGQQTDKRFKVYIGNDASPVNPLDLIKNSLQTIDFEYFEYQENLGEQNLAKQWERVIGEIGKEEWIMILGDDDELEPNVVEEFYRNLDLIEKNNISLIKFSQVAIDDESNEIRKATKLPAIYSSKKFLEERLTSSFPNSLSEHIFSKKMFEKFRFKSFPLAWHSDDLAIFEFANLKDFLFIKNAKVRVRISVHSISGQDNSDVRKQKATYEFCEYLLSEYHKELSMSFINLLVKRYREIIWKNGFVLSLNLPKIYLQHKNLNGFVRAVKIQNELKNRISHLEKK